MDIIKEQLNELNAVVKIQLSPEDYLEQVEKSLKEYGKKASMPGFRPGKVPFGMIKKMHGKAVLIEEVNKILSNSLFKYISDNKIEILGNPLPNEEGAGNIDWDNQKNFEFKYDLGLAPQFSLEVDEKHKFEHYLIGVDESQLDGQIETYRKRYGKVSSSPEVSEADMLHIRLTELSDEGNALEGGVNKSSTLLFTNVKEEETRAKLMGQKVGGTVILDPRKLSENEADLAAMLGVDKESLNNVSSSFELKVENISKHEGAELDQALFDKIFGESVVSDLDTFRSKIKEELQADYDDLTEGRILNDIAEYLIDNLKISLPDEFLKKWMVAVSEKPVTLDEISKEYDKYSKGLRWQLIENKIIKDNEINVTQEELVAFASKTIKKYYSRYGIRNINEEEFSGIVKNMMADKEEVKRLNDRAYDQKILEYFKKAFKFNSIEISFDEYTSKMQEKKQ